MTNQNSEVLGKRGRMGTISDHGDGQATPQPKRSRAQIRTLLDKDESPLDPTASASTPQSDLATHKMPIFNANRRTPSAPGGKGHMSSKDIFDFMSLPTELRLHIYHMALVRAETIELHTSRPKPAEPEESSTTTQETEPDALHIDNTTIIEQTSRRRAAPSPTAHPSPQVSPPADPLVPVILRLNKQINQEARSLLYSENTFKLKLHSGIYTLSTLHQRSRSLIKHVVLTISSHHDILDDFADLVRRGLRYCWGLKSFRIIFEGTLPDGTRGNASSVYANAFHILRWLPRGCSVVLEGCVYENVRRVVLEEGRLMNCLDERSYLKRQHQMPERH